MSKQKNKERAEINEEVEYYIRDKANTNKTKSFIMKFSKKCKTKKQKELYKTILDNKITFVSGPPGTGKSIISLMAALEFITNKEYNIKKITLTKPIIEAAKSIGFLKGTKEEKTEPYFYSFYDNLVKLSDPQSVSKLKESGMIEEVILNFIRGNTFGGVDENGLEYGYVVILDESQNTLVSELKTFITRMGENSRLIILGDEDQSDIKLKNNEINGLSWAFKYMTDIDGVGHFRFDDDDIVRDPFLIKIIKRFREYENDI